LLCGLHALLTLYVVTAGRAFKDRSGACTNVSGESGATRHTKQTADVRVSDICDNVHHLCLLFIYLVFYSKASYLIQLPQCPGLSGGVNIPGGKSWTERWMCFDNSYFCRSNPVDDKDLLWLPTDNALFESPEFKPYYKKYSTDQSAFFNDYARAHKKMSELGSRFDPPGGLSIS
jgi:hypothetical protein